MNQPEFVSYAEAVMDVLSATPERPVVTTADGTHLTAGEFRDSTCRLAGELADRGAGRGTTVALLTGNTAEALGARYAAHLAGARVVNLYDGMSAPALADIVTSADTDMLLVDREQYAAVKELRSLVDVPVVLALGPGSAEEDVVAASARQPARPPAVRIAPDDHRSIRHTGGTTGIPKGILALHGSYRRALDSPLGDRGDRPRYLACTSIAHLAGLYADLHLYRGGSVVLQRGFDPGEVLAAIERERITHIWLLPPQLYQLLDHPALAGTDLSSLRRLAYGGCPASPARLREALDVFGPVLESGYGQAEAQNITALAPHEHGRTGHDGRISVGRAVPGVQLAVRDADGTTLPPGEQGEIQVRSPGVMPGYWKRPDLTAEVLQDGWLRTGDLGYLDEDGYLYVVDRLRDVIIVVGGHVCPSELEELLLTHPAVARVAVFGVRDADAVEHVHAAVVPAPGHQPDQPDRAAVQAAVQASVQEFVTARKGRMHAPEEVHLVDDIPLTAAGKPDRNLLRSLGRNQ
ncbi:AMP-binding protein [Streptomyces bambusae]|uniref:AMP-binding protein n=1 Tax=Streptomyces bambusae TaxID=1550616 RepID=A0ABS6ZGG4_9ACTN|nr:AMP-binding protein [Streptomyces bambusae]MBW5486842.1 AMP-binding protein [Streptomyces bambusae]